MTETRTAPFERSRRVYLLGIYLTSRDGRQLAGDVIARIDQRDYRIAHADAKAQLAATQATAKNLEAQIAAQHAQISASIPSNI
ncbi:hypothetical protein [Methylocystis sp.]|uniref:hypothetical protein n=1 Tax=Methylocystis sp. TaxID=1911079 RepID=UPI003DA36D24